MGKTVNLSTLPLILASSSPRRIQLLSLLGIPFENCSHMYDESDIPKHISAEEIPEFLACKKAQSLSKKFSKNLIIGSDTIVVHNGNILGKPDTKEKAKINLLELSGRTHLILTGYAILDSSNNNMSSGTVVTKIKIKNLSIDEIEFYLDNENVLDMAGGYDHEKLGAILIESIEGDFYSSIGFPLSNIYDELKTFIYI